MTYNENPDGRCLETLVHLKEEVTHALAEMRGHLEELWPPGSKVQVFLNSRQVNPSAGAIECWDPYHLTARVLLDKPQADPWGRHKYPRPVRKHIPYQRIVK